MKTLTTIIAIAIITTLFSSCVSTKNHNASMADKDRTWANKYNQLEGSYNDLRAERDLLEASSSKELNQKESELSKKERELRDRENKVKELRSLINSQRDAIKSLKAEVCSALKCFTPEELQVEVRDGKLYVSMSDKLLFPSGSDKVNERGVMAITMLSVVLANSDLEIMVEGHTDNVPIASERNRDNWDLSVHRATSVTRIMVDNGIARNRVIACGRGEFKPVAANETTDGRQLNRRTEIVLAPRLGKLWELTEEETITSDTGNN